MFLTLALVVVLDRKTGEMFTLTPAVIRGVESQGMLCSADELGVSERGYQEEDGILILNRIFPNVGLGEDVQDVLGFDKDYILDVAPTANPWRSNVSYRCCKRTKCNIR